MSYFDIFILGWNLNVLAFLLNFLISLRVFSKSEDRDLIVYKMNELKELQVEFEKYYPNRKFEVLTMYFIPFASFFRTNYRIVEMFMFFSKNRNTSIYDFMIYKYSSDINKAKFR